MRIVTLALSAAAAALALLAGHTAAGRLLAKKDADVGPDKIAFDWYRGQTGLDVEPGHDEITLTTTDDPSKVRMAVYSRPAGDGAQESKTTYLVSARALKDAMALVRKHRMAEWNESALSGMTGGLYVCKFWREGEFVRVSSERMPEGGAEVFEAIHAVLAAYIEPEQEVQ